MMAVALLFRESQGQFWVVPHRNPAVLRIVFPPRPLHCDCVLGVTLNSCQWEAQAPGTAAVLCGDPQSGGPDMWPCLVLPRELPKPENKCIRGPGTLACSLGSAGGHSLHAWRGWLAPRLQWKKLNKFMTAVLNRGKKEKEIFCSDWEIWVKISHPF